MQRLKTDRIDLYQAHNAKMTTIENDDLFALLEKVKQEGKIRAYGVSIGPAIGWALRAWPRSSATKWTA